MLDIIRVIAPVNLLASYSESEHPAAAESQSTSQHIHAVSVKGGHAELLPAEAGAAEDQPGEPAAAEDAAGGAAHVHTLPVETTPAESKWFD